MFLFKKPPSPALYDERSDQLTYLYISAAQLSTYTIQLFMI